jgi:hypothetical protein
MTDSQFPTYQKSTTIQGILSESTIVLSFMVGLLVLQIVVQLWAALSWGNGSWELTEWLINYEGGFVRRGLIGSLTGYASAVTGIQANNMAILTALATYLLLVIWLLREATSSFPASLVLSCFVMGFPAYQDCILRKDCLGLLLFLACLKVDGSRLSRPLAVVLINLLAAFAILSHESFFLYAIPALVIFRPSGSASALTLRTLVYRGLTFIPATVVFLLTTVFHGNPSTAVAINRSWIPLWRAIDPFVAHPETPTLAIQAVGWTSADGLSYSIAALTKSYIEPMLWIFLIAVSFLAVVLFAGRNEVPGFPAASAARTSIASILLTQLVFVSPLFLVAIDYGRWLFIWVTGSIIIHVTQRDVPGLIQSFIRRCFRILRMDNLAVRFPVRAWYLLFLGFPIGLSWDRLPDYPSYILASPAGRHLFEMWKITGIRLHLFH